MADPTMPNSSDPISTPTHGSSGERPQHDRELPVAVTEGDQAAPHRADSPPEQPSSRESSELLETNADSPSADGAQALTEDQVKLALRRVKDPELNLNILDLGLVYEIRVDGTAVAIDMTLTSPGCPSGPEIMSDAERHLKALPGVGDVSVNLVWSPFWSPDRIEPRVRAYLGF